MNVVSASVAVLSLYFAFLLQACCSYLFTAAKAILLIF